jgi:hypothetical protein
VEVAAGWVSAVSVELDDFDKCIKNSYMAAQLFAAAPIVRDEILWWRWTHVCRAPTVTVSRRGIELVGYVYVMPSIILAEAREEYEIVAMDRMYRVKQVSYYAVNADECIDSVEKCVFNEMSSVRLLRTDVTCFEKLP